MLDAYQRVVVEVALLGTALIFGHQELAVVIELTEVIVEEGYVDGAGIVVFQTGGIAIVHLHGSCTCEPAASQYDETGLVDHVEHDPFGHVDRTAVGNDNLAKTAYALVAGDVPCASDDDGALGMAEGAVVHDALSGSHADIAVVLAGDLEVSDKVRVADMGSFFRDHIGALGRLGGDLYPVSMSGIYHQVIHGIPGLLPCGEALTVVGVVAGIVWCRNLVIGCGIVALQVIHHVRELPLSACALHPVALFGLVVGVVEVIHAVCCCGLRGGGQVGGHPCLAVRSVDVRTGGCLLATGYTACSSLTAEAPVVVGGRLSKGLNELGFIVLYGRLAGREGVNVVRTA